MDENIHDYPVSHAETLAKMRPPPLTKVVLSAKPSHYLETDDNRVENDSNKTVIKETHVRDKDKTENGSKTSFTVQKRWRSPRSAPTKSKPMTKMGRKNLSSTMSCHSSWIVPRSTNMQNMAKSCTAYVGRLQTVRGYWETDLPYP